jgi:hypothetical protein
MAIRVFLVFLAVQVCLVLLTMMAAAPTVQAARPGPSGPWICCLNNPMCCAPNDVGPLAGVIAAKP